MLTLFPPVSNDMSCRLLLYTLHKEGNSLVKIAAIHMQYVKMILQSALAFNLVVSIISLGGFG